MSRFLLVLALAVLGASSVLASVDRQLFRDVPASDVRLPEAAKLGSVFVKMDGRAFERLATGDDFLCRIEDFPLGQDTRATLRVEQFDVVGRQINDPAVVPQHVFLRGFVEGSPNSHVFLALFADQAFGYIVHGDRTYSVSAAAITDDGSLILGSTIDSTSFDDFSCGNIASRDGLSSAVGSVISSIRQHALGTPSSDSLRLLTVALELDHPFVAARGGSAQASLAYALSVLAAASDLYTRDAGIALQCDYHLEHVSDDPYTAGTACELLWETSAKVVHPQPSMWVIMSGRPTDWCGGVAEGIGVLCQSQPSPHCICGVKGGVRAWDYPYKSFVWDIMVTAHETGHLVASPHTHNCMWNPPIDSCVESEGDCYVGTYPTRGTIMSYCHTTSAGASLKFHPLCSALMQATLDQRGCDGMTVLPQITLSPSTVFQECDGGPYIVFASPRSGAGGWQLEVSPKPDSIQRVGNGWRLVLNSSRYQRFYIRVSDSLGNRSYDSVTFEALPGFDVQTTVDTVTSGDSAILIAHSRQDIAPASVKWYKVGSAWSLSSGDTFRVARTTTAAYYCTASTAGGCVARDTVSVEAVTAGVGDPAEAMSIRVVPNPARSAIQLMDGPPYARCWIVNVLGAIVSRVQPADSKGFARVEVQSLPVGSYYLVYETSDAHGCLKFRKE